MYRFFVFLFSLLLVLATASYAQEKHDIMDIPLDTVVAEEHKQIEYWKSGYYDSIPKNALEFQVDSGAYEAMLPKYQNKDFEYVESISDKLSFLDKIIESFYKFIESLFPNRPQTDIDSSIFKVLGIVGGVLVLFLLYRLIFQGKKVYIQHESEEDDYVSQVDFVEKNLLDVNIQTYLQEAVQQKNFPLAIRYQHLLNIQLLATKGLIKWKQSKTNMELMQDISNPELEKDFLDCARIFDYTWFGDFAISEQYYKRYSTEFEGFQRKWS